MGRRKDIPTSVASAGFTSRRSRADRQTAHSGVRPRIASNQANVNDNRGEYHVKATSGFAASNCRASSSPARNSTARDSTARDSTATNRSIASPRGNSQACYFERRSSCSAAYSGPNRFERFKKRSGNWISPTSNSSGCRKTRVACKNYTINCVARTTYTTPSPNLSWKTWHRSRRSAEGSSTY